MTTAETKDCAHVCIDPADGADAFVFALLEKGRVLHINPARASDAPANWVGHLIPAARRYDRTAAHQSIADLSDHYAWPTYHTEALTQYGNRHQNYQGNTPHLWHVRLEKEVEHRCWRTTIHAVMDDFGWLVEVPTC